MRRLFTDKSLWTDEANGIHAKAFFVLEKIAKECPEVDIRDLSYVLMLAAESVGTTLALNRQFPSHKSSVPPPPVESLYGDNCGIPWGATDCQCPDCFLESDGTYE